MRYTLEKYKGLKTRFNCPRCNGKKTFTRYIDIETNEYLSEHIGRCERIDNCKYHELPPIETKCFNVPFNSIIDYNDKTFKITCNDKQTYYLPKSQIHERLNESCYVSEWFLLKTDKKPIYLTNDVKYYSFGIAINHLQSINKPILSKPKSIFTIPLLQLEETLINYDNNNFALILAKLFGFVDAAKLLSIYGIGTSNKWFGANIFWQIDYMGIVRTGKIMLYNAETLKRVKEPYDHISWIHKGLIEDTQELKQCFFGEHLINRFPSKPIAIVESEKTAIICTHFMPDYVWLSAGNINGLNIEKFKVLQGRKVVLFPDLNKGYEIWEQKANEFKHIAEVNVSYYLQRIATPEQKAKGLDLADYLIESINVAHVGNAA